MKRTRVLLTTLVSVAVLASGLATAGAAAATPTPTASPTPSASSTPSSTPEHRREVAAVLGRAVVRHGGAVGRVTAVSATSLTVTGPKGTARTFDLTSATRVHVDRARVRTDATIGDITTGARVVVRAPKKSADSSPRDAVTVDVLKGALATPAGSATATS